MVNQKKVVLGIVGWPKYMFVPTIALLICDNLQTEPFYFLFLKKNKKQKKLSPESRGLTRV